MENSLGHRIKQLRTFYNLSIEEFSSNCNLSDVAIYQIEAGKTELPRRTSLQRISLVYGTTTDWLLFGKNEMLPHGKKEIISSDEKVQNCYRSKEDYFEIQNKNFLLEKELERLWQLIGFFLSTSNQI